MHTFIISTIDCNYGCNLLEIHAQYITVEQINILIEILQNMLNDLKRPNDSFYTILNHTINEINIRMCEMEGNTVFCTITENLQGRYTETMVNTMLGDCDLNTMDISISYWVQTAPGEHLSPSLYPYIQTIKNRALFSFEIQSDVAPNWNEVLNCLSISTQ